MNLNLDTINVFGTDIPVGLLLTILRALAAVFIGIPLVMMLSGGTRNLVTQRTDSQQGLVASKLVLYGGIVALVLMVLKDFGFPLNHIFGAAGVVGVAVGFASQTSLSNVISGFFLMGERPFVVGDVIDIGDTRGEVLSIDTLSIKLRTFDNRFVRIPNETILKAQVVNLTRFPIRRLDITVGVAYRENLARVREVLLDIAHQHASVLEEPAPLVLLQTYSASSVDILYGVWVRRQDIMPVKNDLLHQIKERFEAEDIEIPFPHVSLYKGSKSEPFEVRVVPPAEGNAI